MEQTKVSRVNTHSITDASFRRNNNTSYWGCMLNPAQTIQVMKKNCFERTDFIQISNIIFLK